MPSGRGITQDFRTRLTRHGRPIGGVAMGDEQAVVAGAEA
jgi:hypothetical protein